jgi:hypothetical protein
MQWPYALEECLRTLGHLADQLGLASPVIEESDEEVVLREGTTDAPVAAYLRISPQRLNQLVAEARARRGSVPSSFQTDHEERLRAVGRQLDERKAQTLRLELKAGTVAASYFRLGQEAASEAFSDRYLRLLIEEGIRRRQPTASL